MSNLSDLLPAGGSGKTVELVASGTLANGNKVILQSDGTAKVISETNAIVIPSSSNTSRDDFASSGVAAPSVSVDPNDSNKIAVGYYNNYTPTAVIGIISGQTITFGTPVVYYSGSALGEGSIDFLNTANKFVVTYGITGQSWAVIGTVTGSSISFGSAVQFGGGYRIFHTGCVLKGTDKFIAGYRDNNSSNTRIHIGTLSGSTGISWGGYATLQDSYPLNVAFASNADGTKVAFSYRATGTSGSPGYVQVGTVSGTTITLGSAQTFHSGAITDYNKIAFNDNDQIAILYRDASNNGYGGLKIGTVSGTTITLGNTHTFNSGVSQSYSGQAIHTYGSRFCLMVYEGNNTTGFRVYTGIMTGTTISNTASYFLPNTQSLNAQADFVFRNSTDLAFLVRNSSAGTPTYASVVMLGSFAHPQTNLTSTNFIGISEGAFADTETATVMLRGGITTTQSGLTTGSKYYVQGDGTLSTTPDSPSVTAGKALTSTTLLIGGSS